MAEAKVVKATLKRGPGEATAASALPLDTRRGAWWPMQADDGFGPNEPYAGVGCPACGGLIALRRHVISADGTVAPSVACPHKPCTWAGWATLAGWPG